MRRHMVVKDEYFHEDKKGRTVKYNCGCSVVVRGSTQRTVAGPRCDLTDQLATDLIEMLGPVPMDQGGPISLTEARIEFVGGPWDGRFVDEQFPEGHLLHGVIPGGIKVPTNPPPADPGPYHQYLYIGGQMVVVPVDQGGPE